jgi:ParB-like chromosome segregation protein Spo0J
MQRTIENLIIELSKLETDEKIVAINAIKKQLHEISPMKNEPVDCVIWVKKEMVVANDYNPNSVAPPEMDLLKLSISNDGYTQPIVTADENNVYTVIDGFHRTRVGKECKEVTDRVLGYLPVTTIRADREERADRIAATIRHNRARGRHRIDAMSEIIVELKRRNWSDKKIGKELGMEPDEVLRLAQISGLRDAFRDKEFSRAWEPE